MWTTPLSCKGSVSSTLSVLPNSSDARESHHSCTKRPCHIPPSASPLPTTFIPQGLQWTREKQSSWVCLFPNHPCYRGALQRGTGRLQEPCSTYRSEGLEDFFQDFMERLLAAGRDVVLCELQEGQAVLTLAPHVLGPHGGRRDKEHRSLP